MKPLATALLLLAFSVQPAWAEIQGTEITYQAGDTTLKGYLAVNTAKKGPRPGVLVVHEWWGHNDYARKRARMLAELGYTAFAVDMYGDGKTADHPDDAGKFASEVRKNMPVAKARFLAAMELLQAHPSVNPEKIAAIGYCFGGGVALEMARLGVDLAGVASFHGSLGTANPAQKAQVKAKLLVLNGAADPFVNPEQIEQFKQEMTRAEVDFKFINYPGAKHAFTNPDADGFGQRFKLPLEYNEPADRESWAEMLNFFESIFGKGP
jgi:dienelactone hydrolase